MKSYLFNVIVTFMIIVMGGPNECAAQKTKLKGKDYLVTIHTRHGDIKLVLFEKTPIHRENFLKLAQEGFYDSTAFHRVYNNFMVQGGDPNSKPGGVSKNLGQGGPGYTLEAELDKGFKHKRGAVAAARLSDQVNPEKRSSGSQFYIVQNRTGTPHLDGGYTVFGQVLDGFDTIDAIAKEPANRAGKPEIPIYMTVEVKKVKRKKLAKAFGDKYPAG
ncbi:MAG: peptidylprolyl isomerase [Bacteroidota bacterium]